MYTITNQHDVIIGHQHESLDSARDQAMTLATSRSEPVHISATDSGLCESVRPGPRGRADVAARRRRERAMASLPPVPPEVRFIGPEGQTVRVWCDSDGMLCVDGHSDAAAAYPHLDAAQARRKAWLRATLCR